MMADWLVFQDVSAVRPEPRHGLAVGARRGAHLPPAAVRLLKPGNAGGGRRRRAEPGRLRVAGKETP